MSSIGIQDLIVIAAAMILPCAGFIIVGAMIVVVTRIRSKNRQDGS